MTADEKKLFTNTYDLLKEIYLASPQSISKTVTLMIMADAMEAVESAAKHGEECEKHGTHAIGSCPECQVEGLTWEQKKGAGR